MAYVPGTFSTASEAAARANERYIRFLGNVDALSARDREAARRQQQAALDRQMAGLVTPGEAPGFAGLAPPAPQEVYPTRETMPAQVPAPELAAPAPAAPGTAGLAPFRTSPGPIEAGGTPPLPPGGGAYTPEPEASVIGNVIGEYGAGQRATIEYNRLRGSLMTNVFGDIGSWFGSQEDYDKRQAMKARNSEALQWYESPAVRDFMLANPAAIAEATADPLRYYQQNKDKIGKKAAEPAAAVPAAKPVPGQAQPAPIPAPTSVGLATTGALPPATAVPLPDDAAQAKSVTRRDTFVARVTKIPSAVASAQGQEIIRRANELGVDPAAAIAIYGIESDFGAVSGTSGRGAAGVMQVMPDQFKRLKAWFTNEENIRQYNIPQVLVTAATDAKSANDIDAGLLQLKYNELIGLPKNLWGAGYQANANDVLKANAPLARTDGGISNSDYNDAYVALYNEARNYVGVAQTVSADPATNATYNLERYDREQQTYQADYEFRVSALQTEYNQLVDQRNRITQQLQFAQQSGFYNRIPEFQQQLDAIDSLILGVNTKANDLNTTYRTGVEDLNLRRLNEFANIAVFNLRNGDGGALSEMWSRATGQDVQLQPTAMGSYNVYINGQLDQANVPANVIERNFRMAFSEQYRAQEADLAQRMAEEQFKADVEMAKITLQQMGDIEVAKIGQMDKMFPGWTKANDIQDPQTGATVGWAGFGTGANANKFIIVKLKPGEEVRPGVKTADSFDIIIRDSVGLAAPQQ